mmetsp:Transcript_28847/g.32351  ORF Transcript_28847/g.32351 Transcript_28847/m.32351 type:complete len:389 (-) Transcript_28847:236-1402(-)
MKNGSLAVVTGLQSEGGKKLNGSLAVILDNKQHEHETTNVTEKDKNKKQEEKSSRRVHVLIFVLADDTIYGNNDDSGNKNIKISNLIPMSMRQMRDCVSYKKLCYKTIASLVEAKMFHKESLLKFYFESYYNIWPDDFDMTLTYANVLGENYHEKEKAWLVLTMIAPLIPNDFHRHNEFCYDMVRGCVGATKDSSIAVEWALKVTHNNEYENQLAVEALDMASRYCRTRSRELHSDDNTIHNNPDAAALQLATSKVVILRPNVAGVLIDVAAAECLCGNYKKGVHFYRKAISLGQMKGSELQKEKNNLSSAQLQCPGGPLEHCRIIGSSDGQFSYIDETIYPRSSYTISVSPASGEQCLIPTTTKGLAVQRCPIPDPDDKAAFGNAEY